MQLNKRYFYLTCFIIHQYRLRQDIRADILLTSVQATQNAIARAQKEIGFKQSVSQNKALSLLSFARVSYKDLLKQIEAVGIDHSLNDANKITQIKKLLDDYQILDGLSLRLQNRVSDILRYLFFETSDIKEPSPILNAVKHYQKKLGCISKEAPVDFLDTETCKKLWTQEGRFQVSLYKALLFFHVAESLKSGAISLAPAYRYLSLENYLHPKAHWKAHRERLLEETELKAFADIDQLINVFKSKLHKAFITTNNRISKGQNDYVKFGADGKIVLTTPKVDKPDTKPVSTLFAAAKHTSIL